MTYYVMSDMGIEEEFDSFEEADNYIDMNGDPSTLWIATDEDYIDDWEMLDDVEKSEYSALYAENEEYEDDFEPSYNEDEGFDPYMGDYSWDC